MRPKTASIAANIPAFLSKLWKIVNDPDTDHLINWSPDGRSFIIQNQAQFWYNLLPIYYKHNNMSSFIRQLNMYGFHKISSESGGVECERDELKFYHPFFQQDQPNLMKLIKRKMASTKTTGNLDDKVTNVDQISKVLVDVKQLKGRQESVDSQLATMKQENAALWQELALLRQKHMKQQQIVNKLIHFLVHIVNPNRTGLGGLGVKRRYPLMINDGRQSKSPKTDTPEDGPTIHELETENALTDSLLLNEKNEVPNQNSRATSTPSLIDQNLLNIPIIDDSINSPDTLNSEMLLTEDLENNEINNADNLLTESSLSTSTGSVDFPLKETDLQAVICDRDILQAANEYIDINNLGNSSGDETTVEEVEKSSSKHILNSSMRDAMISNLVSGTKAPTERLIAPVKPNIVTDESSQNNVELTDENNESDDNTIKLHSVDGVFKDDLDSHLETTQGELESIKDMLFDGYSLDANALLGLFNSDGDFPLDVPPLTNPNDKNESAETSNNYVSDPMMSGSELMSYNSNQPFVLDFENLFEEQTPDTTMDGCAEETLDLVNMTDDQNQLITPIVIKKEPPTFPTSTSLAAKRIDFK